MNRNKGIWITIISILVIGISVSFATRQYIRKEEEQAGVSAASSFYDGEVSPVVMDSSADAETKAEASGDEGAVPAPVSADVGENIPSDSMEKSGRSLEIPSESGISQREGQPQLFSAAPGSNSRTSAAAEESLGDGPASPLDPEQSGKESYLKRLEETDVQIQKMRAESSDSTTYYLKTLADKELAIWNQEMISIYEDISETLGEEEKQELNQEQQNWLKTRDAKAEEASKRYTGGSLEGVEYSASMAESTRSRAYQLVEDYGDILGQ